MFNKQVGFMILVAIGGLLLIRRFLTPKGDIQAHFEEQKELMKIKSIAAAVEARAEPVMSTFGNLSFTTTRTDPISATAKQVPLAIEYGVKQFDTIKNLFKINL